MEVFIFILYLSAASFAVLKIPFFRDSELRKVSLLCLFYLKIAAGFAYAAFYKLPRYYAGADTWRFYNLSLDEKKWLLHDPVAFVKDLFIYGYSNSGHILGSQNNYWNDLKSNIPIKLMAVMNVMTGSSYYTDIILFNFLFLIGLIGLFKVFNAVFPDKKPAIVIGIFLLPSTLFWCSGIHKDGLILSATGLIVYHFYNGLQRRFSIASIVSIAVCSLLIFSLRNYVLFALFPALFAWAIAHKYPTKRRRTFAIIYGTGIVLFFSLPYALTSLNFPQYVVDRHEEFLQLEGSSAVQLPVLESSLTGFIKFLPYAIDMAFLRPHIPEISNLSYLPAIAETLFLIALLVTALFTNRQPLSNLPFWYFLLFFSLTILLICGYTIPFTGAIVRYRSLVYPFLFTPFLANSALANKIRFNKI